MTIRRLALVLATLAALCACARHDHRPVCPPAAKCLLYGNGAEPISLDPAKIDGVWEGNIVSQLMIGLTDRDVRGRPIPAMATSWNASPDGLTWTFHLRDARWSDGAPVTAGDFVFAMRRVLQPSTASYSAFLLYPIVNAEKVNKGLLPISALGVDAPDPRTLVIHLDHPWINLLLYTSSRVMWPAPEHAVRRWGDAWTLPGRYVSNGPYTVAAWRLGDKVVLRKNPLFWDAGHVCYDEVDFFPTPDAVSNERSVRKGELDISTTVQSNRLSFLRRSGMAAYLRVAPQGGVTYLAFNLKSPGLNDVRVRQALSMAIDRDFITGKLLRGGQTPAYNFVPPGLLGYDNSPKPYWSGWTFAARQAEARRLLLAAGYGPSHPLTLEIKHRNSPDPSLFMPAVQSDWKAVGVNATLQPNDVQVAYQEYEIHDFQVADAGWVSEDPIIYLDLSRSDTGGQNYGDYKNAAYDGELDAALASADPAAYNAHMRRAEQILLADAPLAPLYFISSRNLVHPDITNWVDNPTDNHGVHWLCRRPTPPTANLGAAAS
jgi:oligopeptide transport system substrate-binding protein